MLKTRGCAFCKTKPEAPPVVTFSIGSAFNKTLDEMKILYELFNKCNNIKLITDKESILQIPSNYTDPVTLPHNDLNSLIGQLNSTLLESIIVNSPADRCSSILRTKVYTSPVVDFIETRILIVLLFISFLMNLIVVILLSQKSMQNASNSILLGIALADLCSSIAPLPFQMIYAIDRTFMVRSRWLAYLYQFLSIELPTLAHTISVWFTILLAVQRYFFICRPIEANKRSICKQRPVLYLMIGLLFIDVIFHIHALVPLSFQYAVEHKTNITNISSIPDVLALDMQMSIYKCTNTTAENRLTWLTLRTLVVHFGPSMVLIVFTIFLVFALNRISRKRKLLLNNKAARKLSYILANQKSTDQQTPSGPHPQCDVESGSSPRTLSATSAGVVVVVPSSTIGQHGKKYQIANESSDSISKMMIVVLILFLIGETPTTIQISLYTIHILLGKPTMLQEFRSIANAFLVMTYPANFFVYYIMSTNFRETLRSFLSWRSKCTRNR